jgi:hypothetical protein
VAQLESQTEEARKLLEKVQSATRGGLGRHADGKPEGLSSCSAAGPTRLSASRGWFFSVHRDPARARRRRGCRSAASAASRRISAARGGGGRNARSAARREAAHRAWGARSPTRWSGDMIAERIQRKDAAARLHPRQLSRTSAQAKDAGGSPCPAGPRSSMPCCISR